MASLIIVIKTTELEYIDLTRGQYLFGISDVNETIINNSTYQLSNRFDNLKPGLYHWAVKNVQTNTIKAKGIDIVNPNDTKCKTIYVNNLNLINITEHGLEKVNDIECFEFINNEYFKFLPDEAIINLDNSVTVKTHNNFTGKITLC